MEREKNKKERLITARATSPFYLSKIGLCGLDDFTDLNLLDAGAVPSWIEFGFLFYPEREGKARYASWKWLTEQFVPRFRHTHRFAAHFCSTRCEEVLTNKVDEEFMEQIYALGFRRIQLNATKMNGFDSSTLIEMNAFLNLLHVATAYPHFEFIIQMNEETKPIWEPFLQQKKQQQTVPNNIVVLMDASVGTGRVIQSFTPLWEENDNNNNEQKSNIKYGYAGGINPENIETIIARVIASCNNRKTKRFIWLDMESGIRNQSNDMVEVGKIIKIIQTCKGLENEKVIGFV